MLAQTRAQKKSRTFGYSPPTIHTLLQRVFDFERTCAGPEIYAGKNIIYRELNYSCQAVDSINNHKSIFELRMMVLEKDNA